MSTTYNDYEKLLKQGREISLLSSLSMLLEWDQETIMPKGGVYFRAQQIELISYLVHKEKTSAKFEKVLSKLIDMETGKVLSHELDDRKKAALREWRSDFLLEKNLPNDFVKTFSKITSKATSQWAEAKKHNTFDTFLPYLEKIIPLLQQKANFIGWEDHPYDALLNIYEPGMTTKKLDTLFSQLKSFLTNLAKELSLKNHPDT
eukprot:Platyproteum_vivax@DN13142_c0_g1_i1.p1